MIVDRATIPQPKIQNHFHLPEIKRLKISKDVPVLFVEKHSLPIINLTFMFECGSRLDPGDKKGLAYLFSALIDEGAGKYSEFELHDKFDFIGANFSISCDEDYIYFSLQCMTEYFDEALELFASVILSPHFTDEAFSRERSRIITRINQQIDYPDEMADLIFTHKLTGAGSAYAYPVIGLADSINNISPDDIKNFYRKNIQCSTLSVAITSDISESVVISKLNSFFTELKSGDKVSPFNFTNKLSTQKVIIVNYPGAAQSEIRIGNKSPGRNEPGFYSRVLMNTILGGQYSSRINQNLRERNGFTYGASSIINYWKYDAFFCVTTSVNTANTGAAVKEILFELSEIKKGVTDSEAEFACSMLIKKFPLFFETYNQLNGNSGVLFKYDLPDSYFKEYASKIEATGVDEINKATSIVNPDEALFVLAGDESEIKKQLDFINENDIVTLNPSDNNLFI
ncbi:MAG: insulinase family protein [Ignavibacteriales bacterium]|nr:MAG: insulinase family protein [Ignavibacteriales bacterium]